MKLRLILLVLAAELLLVLPAWALNDFTFVQISDTHVSVKNPAFSARYQEVVRQINAIKPAFVIHTGDAVDIMSLENVRLFKEISDKNTPPVYIAPGNHDISGVAKAGADKASESVNAWKQAVGYDRISFEYKDCVFIGLDANLWNSGYSMEKEQLRWLESELRKAKKKRIFVFQHIPLFLQTPTDANGDYFAIDNPARSKLLELFKSYRVEGVLTGHYHRVTESVLGPTSFLTTGAISYSCATDQGMTGYSVFHVFPGGFTHHFIDLRTVGTPPDFNLLTH